MASQIAMKNLETAVFSNDFKWVLSTTVLKNGGVDSDSAVSNRVRRWLGWHSGWLGLFGRVVTKPAELDIDLVCLVTTRLAQPSPTQLGRLGKSSQNAVFFKVRFFGIPKPILMRLWVLWGPFPSPKLYKTHPTPLISSQPFHCIWVRICKEFVFGAAVRSFGQAL